MSYTKKQNVRRQSFVNPFQLIFEDAIQEYVIAANDVGEKCGNKSLQQKRGKSRMINFLKYEGRRVHGTINPELDIADRKQLTPPEILEAREIYAAVGC